MNNSRLLSLVTGVGLMLSAGVASSTPINGSASISDGIVVPSAPTSSIVSNLTFFDLLNDTLAQSPSGDFATGGNLNPATASAFSLGGSSSPFVTFDNGFVFNLTNATLRSSDPLECDDVGLCGDEIAVRLEGIVEGLAPFTPTFFRGNFTANGGCLGTPNGSGDVECLNNVSASYSATLVATGEEVTIPEPSSIALLGLGLIGIAAARRRLAS